jgi:hypothetical protein
MFNSITFRYNYSYHSNGLKSNQLSLNLHTRKLSGKPRIRNKKNQIAPNRLIHIPLWPKRFGVLKDISFFPEREIDWYKSVD